MSLRAEQQAHKLWSSFLTASLFWLAVGGISGLLLVVHRTLPFAVADLSFVSIGRLQLYHESYLIFGGGFMLLFGLWFLRLRALLGGEIRLIELWNAAFWTWNVSLGLAFLSTFFGYHSTTPILSWIPEIYTLFCLALFLFIIALACNLPSSRWLFRTPAFLLLFGGLGMTFLALVLLLLFPKTMLLSSSLVLLIVCLGLILPALGLLLPISGLRMQADLRRWLNLFFWASLILVPLSVPFFSVDTKNMGFAVVMQWLLLVPTLGLLRFLWREWSQPVLYAKRFFLGPDEDKVEAETQEETTSWGSFLQMGGICFALVAIEAFAFGNLKLLQVHFHPGFLSTHLYLLLFGCFAFWALAGLCLLLDLDWQTFQQEFIRFRRYFLAGLVLLVTSGWLESLLWHQMAVAGVSPGTVSLSISHWVALAGWAFLAYAVYVFYRSFRLDLSI